MNYTKGGFPVWDEEFDKEHFTPEELAESDLHAELIAAMVQARKEQGLTQRALEARSGVSSHKLQGWSVETLPYRIKTKRTDAPSFRYETNKVGVVAV